MRSKRLGNGWRLYLNEHDYRVLLGVCDSLQNELAVRFGGECGLRVSETVNLEPGDIRESTHPHVEAMFLRVRHGKDTSGKRDEGKYRDAFVPARVEGAAREYAMREGLDDEDPFFDVCKRTLQGYLKDVGRKAAEETGEEDWKKFSSHDLRAFFATNLLVRYDVNPEVVKEIGGWSDYKALKPYLDTPSDDIIAESLGAVAPVENGYTGREPEGDGLGEQPMAADD
jgi:integrase